MAWHPSTQLALGKLRAEELIREADEWRTACLAAQCGPEPSGRLASALAWWRSHLSRRRAENAPLAEPEQS